MASARAGFNDVDRFAHARPKKTREPLPFNRDHVSRPDIQPPLKA